MPTRLTHTGHREARSRLYLLVFWALALTVHLSVLHQQDRAADNLQALLFLAAALAGSLALHLGMAEVPSRPHWRRAASDEARAETPSEQLLRVKIERKRQHGHPLAILVAEISISRSSTTSANETRRVIAAAHELLRRYIDDDDGMARLSGNRVAALISGSVNMHELENMLDRLNEDMRAWTRSSLGAMELNVGVVLDWQGRASTDHLLTQVNIAVRRAAISGRGRFILTESAP